MERISVGHHLLSDDFMAFLFIFLRAKARRVWISESYSTDFDLDAVSENSRIGQSGRES